MAIMINTQENKNKKAQALLDALENVGGSFPNFSDNDPIFPFAMTSKAVDVNDEFSSEYHVSGILPYPKIEEISSYRFLEKKPQIDPEAYKRYPPRDMQSITKWRRENNKVILDNHLGGEVDNMGPLILKYMNGKKFRDILFIGCKEVQIPLENGHDYTYIYHIVMRYQVEASELTVTKSDENTVFMKKFEVTFN